MPRLSKFILTLLCVIQHSYFVIHAGRKKSKKEPRIIKEFCRGDSIWAIPTKLSEQISLPADSPISRK
jgi:hypothetical protein